MQSEKNSIKGWLVIAVTLLAFVGGALAGGLTLYMKNQISNANPSGADAEAGGDMGGMPPGTVRVEPGESQIIQERFRVVGRLREIRRATVSSEVSGRLIDVPIQEGDRVIGGKTVLAQIDDVWAKADLAAAQADVSEAEASLLQAKQDMTMLEELEKALSAKPREVQEARNMVAQREAHLLAATALRDRRQQEVARVTIVAPFDGVVVYKMADVGQWVAPGTPVAEVVSSGKIDARLNVSENVINQLKAGDVLDVQIEPLDRTVQGKVVAINPTGDNAARTFPVDVRLDDLDGALKLGMSVESFVPVGEPRQTLVVPRDAVLTRQGRSLVWVAMPSEQPDQMPTAMSMPVNILFGVDANNFAVRPLPTAQGQLLTSDMLVVVEGAERLFPMQPLLIQNKDGQMQMSGN